MDPDESVCEIRQPFYCTGYSELEGTRLLREFPKKMGHGDGDRLDQEKQEELSSGPWIS
jgi:hypothetical protein